VEVAPLAGADLRDEGDAEPSARVRTRVAAARERQLARGAGLNATLAARPLKKAAPVESAARELLEKAVDRLALSARSHLKVLRVALTIADLSADGRVEARHVAEALRYRPATPGV
jgi:magnesium chelatase family protein